MNSRYYEYHCPRCGHKLMVTTDDKPYNAECKLGHLWELVVKGQADRSCLVVTLTQYAPLVRPTPTGICGNLAGNQEARCYLPPGHPGFHRSPAGELWDSH